MTTRAANQDAAFAAPPPLPPLPPEIHTRGPALREVLDLIRELEACANHWARGALPDASPFFRDKWLQNQRGLAALRYLQRQLCRAKTPMPTPPAPPPPRVICAWCQAEISPGGEPTSHGICVACKAKEAAEIPLPAEGQKP